MHHFLNCKSSLIGLSQIRLFQCRQIKLFVSFPLHPSNGPKKIQQKIQNILRDYMVCIGVTKQKSNIVEYTVYLIFIRNISVFDDTVVKPGYNYHAQESGISQFLSPRMYKMIKKRILPIETKSFVIQVLPFVTVD